MTTLERLKQGTTGDQVILRAINKGLFYAGYKTIWRQRRELVPLEEPVDRNTYNRFAVDVSKEMRADEEYNTITMPSFNTNHGRV